MKKLVVLLVILATLFLFPVNAGANDDKVTICHAAGRAGTTKFVTITIDRSALKAHFQDNGTPQAGHEQDYFGACKVVATPTPSESAKPSAKPSETPKPTETAKSSASPSAKASASPSAAPTKTPAAPSTRPAATAPAKPAVKALPNTSTN